MLMKPFIVAVFVLFSSLSLAFQQCSLEKGGGICPDGNTCCPLKQDGLQVSGCVPNDMGSFNATCCSDGKTACAVNYTCETNGKCHAIKELADPLVQVMPRYTLCHPDSKTLSTVHGFPILKDAKLAYYSSHGDISNLGQSDGIQMALIVIHGAGRNADDYYCSATAAVGLQQRYPSESVLVIAPRFTSTADAPISLNEGGTPLLWRDEGDGPWRYGASAVLPEEAIHISSFDTIDRIVTLLNNNTDFPNLKRIVIAGHSSGGQFVQRYALLASFWNVQRMSGVVANPSNYAYLTPLRLINGTWRIPNKDKCSQYNEWEYGLENGGDMIVPYKDEALKKLDYNITALIQRFGNRKVSYLAGEADRCNVSESQHHNGWCFSHGLETSCADMLQGTTRWERNLRHVASLRKLGVSSKTQERRVVPGVGHDHSLIFTSPVGLDVLFPLNPSRLDVLTVMSSFL